MGLKFGSRLVNEEQWKFLPYTFPPGMSEYHREIDSDRILPFVGKSKKLASSVYADVFKVNIDASEQAFFPKETSEVQVIKKSLKPNVTSNRVQQERLCLRLLNQLKHPNIVCFLGSYTYLEQHHFLFPCFDLDLSEFLERDFRLGNFESDVTFYLALRGLGSALSHIHQLHLNRKTHGVDFDGIGWHHDLQPANILVSKDTFLLTDFGLANFQQGSAKPSVLWQRTCGDYIAPECMDAEQTEQIVDQAIDVWAFGCLIAEVAAYMQKGAPGVEDFSNHRLSEGGTDCQFYDTNRQTKASVKKWLESLNGGKSEERLIPSLINTSLHALTADPHRRPNIMHVTNSLTLLSLKAHFDSVQKQFSDTRALHGITAGDNLWFLQERFRAWGRILALDKNDAVMAISDNTHECYHEFIRNMDYLFQELNDAALTTFYTSEARFGFEDRVDRMVENLWSLLPIHMRKLTKECWYRAVLNADWTDASGEVYGTLKSRSLVYKSGDDASMLESIRRKAQADKDMRAKEEKSLTISPDSEYKSKIAFALGKLMKKLHTIARLHEGFNSQPVPVFRSSTDDTTNDDGSWRSYVFGLYVSITGATVRRRTPLWKEICGTISTQSTVLPSTATVLGLAFGR
ncbi:hypothetical protein G7Z17_g3541 [Cylindrodendrum hubeiense]|uniref:Protein kinase domain-containing protein n=1 Tax=Cylindrodendrum hubeiense TaxID=595255 RepID=A0A9P5LJV3_9HYPO|nr:hypothetical protein G7Z17_g3541 [Cylindrodendrum hubeiense]